MSQIRLGDGDAIYRVGRVWEATKRTKKARKDTKMNYRRWGEATMVDKNKVSDNSSFWASKWNDNFYYLLFYQKTEPLPKPREMSFIFRVPALLTPVRREDCSSVKRTHLAQCSQAGLWRREKTGREKTMFSTKEVRKPCGRPSAAVCTPPRSKQILL